MNLGEPSPRDSAFLERRGTPLRIKSYGAEWEFKRRTQFRGFPARRRDYDCQDTRVRTGSKGDADAGAEGRSCDPSAALPLRCRGTSNVRTGEISRLTISLQLSR